MNNRRRYSIVALAASMAAILLMLGLAAPSRAQQQQPPGFEQTVPALGGDLAGAATAGSLELLAQVGGEITSVVSDGEYLYVNSGPRLPILTLEANPQVVGRSEPLPATVWSVAVTGDTAIAATWPRLCTFDVSNPTHPILLGQLFSTAYHVLAAGDYAYAISANSIDIVDISDPAHPQSAAIFSGTQTAIDSATIQGNLMLLDERYFYCGKFGCSPYEEHYILLVDLSDPTNPQVLAEVPMEADVLDLELDGNVAYIRIGDLIHVLDVTEPAEPATVGRLVGLSSKSLSHLAVRESIAYLLAEEELTLYDFTVPLSPVFLGKTTLPPSLTSLTVADNMVAIPSPCGLRMVNVADLTQPMTVGLHGTIQPFPNNRFDESMILDDDVFYLAAGSHFASCLQVLDIGDTSDPLLLSLFEGVPVERLHRQENLLFASGDRTLSFVDISDPLNPVLINSLSLPVRSTCTDLELVVVQDLIYMKCRITAAEYNDVVLILDASNPLAIQLVGQYPLPVPSRSYAIAAVPGFLYLIDESTIAGSGSIIYVVDVNNPASPVLATTISSSVDGSLVDLALDFPELYLLRWDGFSAAVQIFDIGEPRHPRHKATFPAPGYTIVPADGYVYNVGGESLTVYTRPPSRRFLS